jgi:crotonobetainyl-CoA:carnitine CoA-transferase CaiB-like acyl-CoA transferase
MAALLLVEAGGPGTHLDMSVMGAEAASADFTMTYLTSHSYTGRTSTPPPPSPENPVTGLGPLPNGTFECRDGPVVVSTMPQWVPRMLALVDDPVLTELFGDRARLAEPGAAAIIDERVAAWFAGRSRYEAMVEAQAAGWAVTSIQSPAELRDDPHVMTRGAIVATDHPAAGRVAQLGPPIRLADGWAMHRPAPRLGEHNDEVLAELGLGPAELVAYRAAEVV